MKKKRLAGTAVVLASVMAISGCSQPSVQNSQASSSVLLDAETLSTFKSSDEYTDWSSESHTEIKGEGSSVSISGSGITAEGCRMVITQPGTYVFSGSVEDGSITVSVPDSSKVRIVFSGFTLSCSDGPAVDIESADKVTISLSNGTKNSLSDSGTRSDETLTAAVYSKSDLVLNGNGALTVDAGFDNAIQSKGSLRITGGTYSIDSKDDGFVGKDSVEVENGNFSLNCGGDAFKSTNSDDSSKGYIYIEDGTYDITASDDGFQSASGILIKDGTFSITSGGGSTFASQHAEGGFQMKEYGGMPGASWNTDAGASSDSASSDSVSSDSSSSDSESSDSQGGTFGIRGSEGGHGPQMPDGSSTSQDAASASSQTEYEATSDETKSRGLVSDGSIEIDGGTFTFDTSDDSLHGDTVSITGGSLEISAGDDAVHADTSLSVSGGSVSASECYEGLESASIVISGGAVDITSSDDGLNASDGASADTGTGQAQDAPYAASGSVGAYTSGGPEITIAGGTVHVSSGGDGIDSNGSILQSGGEVTVDGPTDDGNGAIDYNGTYDMTGGSLMAAGSSGMLQSISDSSKACCLVMVFTETQDKGEKITIKDSDGNAVYEYAPAKEYQSFVYASDKLAEGSTYSIYSGDEKLTDVTLSGTVTEIDDAGKSVTAGTGNTGEMQRKGKMPDDSAAAADTV